MSADAPTLRANLFESLHLTRSRELRRRLADYLRSGRARNVYESRMGASALVKILDQDTVDALVDLLQPGGDEKTVAAVLEFLPAT